MEFKGSAPWPTLQRHIVRTVIAMTNLRGGGTIVIGMSEGTDSWQPTGVTQQDLATFDPDVVVEHVNRFASQPVTLDMVIVDHEARDFLAIHSREFDRSPTICRRACDANGSGFQAGTILIRPGGKPCTRPVRDAVEVQDLLDLAAEKRARSILEAGRRIGLTLAQDDSDRFDRELDGL